MTYDFDYLEDSEQKSPFPVGKAVTVCNREMEKCCGDLVPCILQVFSDSRSSFIPWDKRVCWWRKATLLAEWICGGQSSVFNRKQVFFRTPTWLNYFWPKSAHLYSWRLGPAGYLWAGLECCGFYAHVCIMCPFLNQAQLLRRCISSLQRTKRKWTNHPKTTTQIVMNCLSVNLGFRLEIQIVFQSLLTEDPIKPFRLFL